MAEVAEACTSRPNVGKALVSLLGAYVDLRQRGFDVLAVRVTNHVPVVVIAAVPACAVLGGAMHQRRQRGGITECVMVARLGDVLVEWVQRQKLQAGALVEVAGVVWGSYRGTIGDVLERLDADGNCQPWGGLWRVALRGDITIGAFGDDLVVVREAC